MKAVLLAVLLAAPAVTQTDPWAIAARHAKQATEALARSNKTMHAWLARRDAKTGLLPRTGKDPNWVVKDSAADLYPFMVLISRYTEPALYDGAMMDILRQERLLSVRLGQLSDDVAAGGGFVAAQPDTDRIIFGSSEYVKDGLLAMTEILGESPWYYRMRTILSDIVRHAPYATKWGQLPAQTAEINGNMLQSLSRMSWRTGDAAYLAQVEAIADFYFLEMLPKTGYIPAHLWDTATGKPSRAAFLFSDHGNEIAGGLAEAYLLMKYKRPEKAAQYREPFLKMISRLLEVGRNADGVWIASVDLDGKPVDTRAAHCWGYLFKPVYIAWMISGDPKYLDAVKQAIRGVTEHQKYLFDETGAGRNWRANAYSDSLESSLVLINRLPDARFGEGIDAGIRKMLDVQTESGIVEDWYGDGNYIRTAMMYAFWKTQGTSLAPWTGKTHAGAVRDGARVMVHVSAEEDWSGRLRFDVPRHRYHWNMAVNYPRLNEWPEWFTVEADGLYDVQVEGAPARVMLGADLVRGIALVLRRGEQRRITVAPR